MSQFKIYFLFNLILACLMISCNDSNDLNNTPQNSGVFDCDILVTALLEQNANSLKSILDPELEKLTLLDQDNNTCLHDNNLKAFVTLLNDNCDEITSSIICCGCIKTLPTISEVLVKVDSSGIEVDRILDLLTTVEGGNPLIFWDIHL